jgi:hypothetical protein
MWRGPAASAAGTAILRRAPDGLDVTRLYGPGALAGAGADRPDP